MRNLILILTSLVSTHAYATGVAHDGAPPGERQQEIVGGTQVPIGKWRDVVLVVGHDASCTGTLIAPDVVLTAGHCIDIAPYEVWVDTVDYSQVGGERIPVKWARAYPSWEDRYDIGVLMLDHVAIPEPRAVASGCTTKSELVADHMIQLVGFGLTRADGSGDNTKLREARAPVIDPTCTMDASCQQAIAPHGEFKAGGDGIDSCFGDSGGPVLSLIHKSR
jgi:secreted trypsin-like serine protease